MGYMYISGSQPIGHNLFGKPLFSIIFACSNAYKFMVGDHHNMRDLLKGCSIGKVESQ